MLTIEKTAVILETADGILELKELPIGDWITFMDYWQTLVKLSVIRSNNETLTDSIMENKSIQEMLNKIFQLWKIDWKKLQPSIINRLIISDNGKEGALFTLHNSFPKFQAIPKKIEKAESFQSQLTGLMRPYITQLRISVLRALSN